MRMHVLLPGLSPRKCVMTALTVLVGAIALMGALLHSPAFADVRRYNVPVDNSPQKGPKDAPVTIIEFLDFQ